MCVCVQPSRASRKRKFEDPSQGNNCIPTQTCDRAPVCVNRNMRLCTDPNAVFSDIALASIELLPTETGLENRRSRRLKENEFLKEQDDVYKSMEQCV